MRIITSKEQFKSVVSTAITDGDSLFESMQPHLCAAEQWLCHSLLGTTLFAEVERLSDVLYRTIQRIVGFRAFYEAIPMLDLILTNNGFAVVHNNNLTPASRERVNALRSQARDSYGDAVDLFIELLYDSSNWDLFRQGQPFLSLTRSLFWTAFDLGKYVGLPNAHRSKLEELAGDITQAELFVTEYISADYYNVLLERKREHTLTPADKNVIPFIMHAMGLHIEQRMTYALKAVERARLMMESSPANYSVFFNSVEYQSKHAERYENRKENSIYFWG